MPINWRVSLARDSLHDLVKLRCQDQSLTGAHRYFCRRAAIRDSAEIQPASNGWPGLSMSIITGA